MSMRHWVDPQYFKISKDNTQNSVMGKEAGDICTHWVMAKYKTELPTLGKKVPCVTYHNITVVFTDWIWAFISPNSLLKFVSF